MKPITVHLVLWSDIKLISKGKMEIARQMLRKDFDLKTIMGLTGFKKSELEKLASRSSKKSFR